MSDQNHQHFYIYGRCQCGEVQPDYKALPGSASGLTVIIVEHAKGFLMRLEHDGAAMTLDREEAGDLYEKILIKLGTGRVGPGAGHVNMKLKYCGCNDHPDRLDLSCAKIRRENGDPLSNAEIWRELHAADQAASDNADWFNALVNDVAEILGCEQKPTAIIAACKQLKEQTDATIANGE